MIKTIIADNEKWVCQLVSDLVDWNALGFSVIGLAYDGAQLLEMIEIYSPDLIITDLRMPGLTGLEVVDEIKKRNLPTGVIIISGYSDFEYAKKAIDLGVFSYLLKPLEQEDLEKTLLNYKNSKSANQENSSEIASLQDKLYSSMASHFDLYIRGLIKGESVPMPIEAINATFNHTFSDGKFRLIAVSVTPLSTGTEYIDKIFGYIHEAFYSAFRPACFDIFSFDKAPHLFFGINYPATSEKLMCSLIEDLLFECINSIPYVSSHSVTIGVGSCCSSLDELSTSYNHAINAIHARLVLGMRKTIYGELLPQPAAFFSKELSNKIFAYLSSHIFDKSPEDFTLELMQPYLNSPSPYAPVVGFQTIYDAAMNSVIKPVLDKYHTLHTYQEDMIRMELLATTNELCALLASILFTLKKHNSFMNEKQNIIDVIKTYISDNLDKELSLSDLAEITHFNPNYLCELFKKETGENLVKYITFKRIETAKILLGDVTLKCSEIALKVGYNDVNYFNRVFKNQLGLTPKQYRKMFIER